MSGPVLHSRVQAQAPGSRPDGVLDANVFLRYLTRDDPAKAEACRAFFEQLAAGKRQAWACEAVIAEVVYVLASPRQYHLPPDQIRDLLTPLLGLRGLKLPQKATILAALQLYANAPAAADLDFEDALTLAHARRLGAPAVISYDADFDAVAGGPARREPDAALD